MAAPGLPGILLRTLTTASPSLAVRAALIQPRSVAGIRLGSPSTTVSR